MQGDYRTDNRVQEVSYISRNLKTLARELNVPVLAAAQLSRAVEQRSDKHPVLSDLRESGSLEQDSDIVMFIYREDKDQEDSIMKNVAEIIVSKHRNGPTGSVQLVFREHLAQFVDAATFHFDQTQIP
jgi:replicative DNA helicase